MLAGLKVFVVVVDDEIQQLCPGLVLTEFMFLFNIPAQYIQHTPETFISVIQYIQSKIYVCSKDY